MVRSNDVGSLVLLYVYRITLIKERFVQFVWLESNVPGTVQNLRLNFHSLRELSFSSVFVTACQNLATLGFWQLTSTTYDLGKWKFVAWNVKFTFKFSCSCTITFQPYRTIIPLWTNPLQFKSNLTYIQYVSCMYVIVKWLFFVIFSGFFVFWFLRRIMGGGGIRVSLVSNTLMDCTQKGRLEIVFLGAKVPKYCNCR